MVFTWRDKGLPLRHILQPLTKHGLNKNVRSLFIWVIEPLEVLEHKTKAKPFSMQFFFKEFSRLIARLFFLYLFST